MDTTDSSSTVGCLTPTTGAEFSEPSSVGFHTPTGTENESAVLSAADLTSRLRDQKEGKLYGESIKVHCDAILTLLPLVYEDHSLIPYIRDSVLSEIITDANKSPSSAHEPLSLSTEAKEVLEQLINGTPERNVDPELQEEVKTACYALLDTSNNFAGGRGIETMQLRLYQAKLHRRACQEFSFRHSVRKAGPDVAERLGIRVGDENTSREGCSDSVSSREVVLKDHIVDFALESPEWKIPSDWRLNRFSAGSVNIPGDFVIEGDFDVQDLSVDFAFSVGRNFEIKGDFKARNSSMGSFFVGGRLLVGGTWVVERDFKVDGAWRVMKGSKVNGGFFVKGKYSVGSSYNTPPLGQLGQTQVTRRSR